MRLRLPRGWFNAAPLALTGMLIVGAAVAAGPKLRDGFSFAPAYAITVESNGRALIWLAASVAPNGAMVPGSTFHAQGPLAMGVSATATTAAGAWCTITVDGRQVDRESVSGVGRDADCYWRSP